MRSTVVGFNQSGKYIGGALSSLTVIGIQKFGWRFNFKVIGMFGMLIGLAFLMCIKDPAYGSINHSQFSDVMPEEDPTHISRPPKEKKKLNLFKGYMSSITNLMKNKVTRYMTFAGMANFVGLYATTYFMPPFF